MVGREGQTFPNTCLLPILAQAYPARKRMDLVPLYFEPTAIVPPEPFDWWAYLQSLIAAIWWSGFLWGSLTVLLVVLGLALAGLTCLNPRKKRVSPATAIYTCVSLPCGATVRVQQ